MISLLAIHLRPLSQEFRRLSGDGASSEKRAKKMASASKLQTTLLAFAPTRALLRRFKLPKPGEGPNKEQREKGRYEVVFFGETADGRKFTTSVAGDRDPGYGSTCKMITGAALCPVQGVDHKTTRGGVWTPGAAMGMTLVKRLQDKAGLKFRVAEPS